MSSSTRVPAEVGSRKEQLYEVIRTHVGPQRAIDARSLSLMLGISEREVQRLITELIVEDGHGEICASTGDGGAFPGSPAGYFWASCREDAVSYHAVLSSRFIAMHDRMQACQLAQERLPSGRPMQMSLLEV